MTPAVAIIVFGRTNGLAARIADLRREGYSIETQVREDAMGRSYPKYVLKGTP